MRYIRQKYGIYWEKLWNILGRNYGINWGKQRDILNKSYGNNGQNYGI